MLRWWLYNRATGPAMLSYRTTDVITKREQFQWMMNIRSLHLQTTNATLQSLKAATGLSKSAISFRKTKRTWVASARHPIRNHSPNSISARSWPARTPMCQAPTLGIGRFQTVTPMRWLTTVIRNMIQLLTQISNRANTLRTSMRSHISTKTLVSWMRIYQGCFRVASMRARIIHQSWTSQIWSCIITLPCKTCCRGNTGEDLKILDSQPTRTLHSKISSSSSNNSSNKTWDTAIACITQTNKQLGILRITWWIRWCSSHITSHSKTWTARWSLTWIKWIGNQLTNTARACRLWGRVRLKLLNSCTTMRKCIQEGSTLRQ